ncbi:MAG TPA: MBL fold metallo-hydrolase [Chthonomonadaceae bacterium]|nr:MBL fold metallo-hydrolase [Chthonomonadaceae bacterium]
MRIAPVAKGIYRVRLAWGNAYLLKTGDRAALIDTGLSQDRAELLAALEEVGGGPDRLEAIYLTHGHCDHAGNAAWLAQQGAQVLAHQAETPYLGLPRRAYIPRGWRRLARPHTALLFAAAERLYPVERREPERTIAEGDVLDAPGGTLRVVHCPGHTPGHIAFWREQDRVLFSGDAIMNIIPFRRITALSLPIRALSDDWKQCKASARRLAELCPDVLLAGHGRPLTEETAARLTGWARTLG